MLLYEGKAKKVYSTESENEFIVYFKDDATAFNGEKKAQISSKGILNNKNFYNNIWNVTRGTNQNALRKENIRKRNVS